MNDQRLHSSCWNFTVNFLLWPVCIIDFCWSILSKYFLDNVPLLLSISQRSDTFFMYTVLNNSHYDFQAIFLQMKNTCQIIVQNWLFQGKLIQERLFYINCVLILKWAQVKTLNRARQCLYDWGFDLSFELAGRYEVE